MLLPRSKRIAGIDGEIERLRLITPGGLVVAVVMILLLFTLIFPRRALLEALHQQEQLDDLTLAYIKNLRHVTTGDDDLTILVTRVDFDRLDYATIEAKLQPIVEKNDARLRTLAERLLNKARLREMRRILVDFHGEPALFDQLRQHYRRIRDGRDPRLHHEAIGLWIETLLRTPQGLLDKDPATRNEVAELITAADARPDDLSRRLSLISLAMMAGMEEEARRLLASMDSGALRQQLPKEAEKALGYGHYETAAMLHLLARELATDREKAREAFRKAIETLMEGGLHAKALATAERYLGDLAEDAPTLRFLAKTALAAGNPQRAAEYARLLVFATQ